MGACLKEVAQRWHVSCVCALRYDETVAVFNNAAGVGLASRLHLHEGEGSAPPLAAGGGALGPGAALGVCTSLSFRTGAGIPLMAVGGGSGE